ncbi:protein-tyrosine phosphatase family protein [Halapricum desulfuricans]|uniref:Protein-tyrosine phosphatase n=1 Tax=Halapricum desulfuricans TaxID=2841257 RepID=A0A897NIE0_9EURY|nr:dual specificity protein phosphatase family protein [Halapricum desulfuricans]QSG14210.1 Protein-tyrosine phosphatase [Halapricum desulfuricans]
MAAPYRFGPAAPEESIVYGSAAPTWRADSEDPVGEWLEFVREREVERVLCLLTDAQLERTGIDLDRYRDVFGPGRVAHVPITDHQLADKATLREALAVLEQADSVGESIVVHCLAGIGRTGHVLAAWLVSARGYGPDEAITTVSKSGRTPDEAVKAGNATREGLLGLLQSVA